MTTRLLLPLAGITTVLLGALVFGGLGDNLTYYRTPSEAVELRDTASDSRPFRLAGHVVPGSVATGDGVVRFALADAEERVQVRYTGTPPQLFSDDIEVVVEGTWDGEVFASETMLVKHDEEYYPPTEVPSAAAAEEATP